MSKLPVLSTHCQDCRTEAPETLQLYLNLTPRPNLNTLLYSSQASHLALPALCLICTSLSMETHALHKSDAWRLEAGWVFLREMHREEKKEREREPAYLNRK